MKEHREVVLRCLPGQPQSARIESAITDSFETKHALIMGYAFCACFVLVMGVAVTGFVPGWSVVAVEVFVILMFFFSGLLSMGYFFCAALRFGLISHLQLSSAPTCRQAVLSVEKALRDGERSGECPDKRGSCRFCLAEKESLHIPQGLRDAQVCVEQVAIKPEWNQGRHDESEAGNPTGECWKPITLPLIGRRSLFAVEKQREVPQWNVTPACHPPASVSRERCPGERDCMGRGSFSLSRFHSISDRSGYQALQEVVMLTIDINTTRRFILGKQGLWPGRRWRGIEGTEQAMHAMEYLQLDPLQIIARSQDITLHSRVLDYTPGMWEDVTYQQRKFFDWGDWLAVRAMDELPHWRVVMRRERESGSRLRAIARDHADAIVEMRAVLHERGVVSNRDFAMATRTRTQNYRGRKDSALALYYLWRTGEVMTHHRDRFERAYALTEKSHPRIFFARATKPRLIASYSKRTSALAAYRVSTGRVIRFGAAIRLAQRKRCLRRCWLMATSSRCRWKAGKGCTTRSGATPQSCAQIAQDACRRRGLRWRRPRRKRLSSSHRSITSARAGEPKEYLASTTCGRSTSLSISGGSATTLCRFCGEIGSSRGSTANSTGRPTPLSSWACGWRMRLSATMRHLRRHWFVGLRDSFGFSARASWMQRRFASRCCADAHALHKEANASESDVSLY